MDLHVQQKEIYVLKFSELLKKTVILEDLDGVYTAITYYFLRKYNTSLWIPRLQEHKNKNYMLANTNSVSEKKSEFTNLYYQAPNNYHK